MATDVDFLQFVLDQLAGTPGITHRRMFGEYALYQHGKVVAFLCDNQCFLKPTEAGRALQAADVGAYRVRSVLSPAWTTDWITPEGHRKLRDFGIAPPAHVVTMGNARPIRLMRPAQGEHIACPQCGSHDTVLISAFGSTACKALYRCRACREPFDYFKPY